MSYELLVEEIAVDLVLRWDGDVLRIGDGPPLSYLSVCSGIEAATVAWEGLGWEPTAFAEVDPFPSRVLAHHYPDVLNLGDMTRIDPAALGPVDVLVGGTPCQAFSTVGKRLSLADARGNLSLVFAVLFHGLVRCNGCRWAVWENVPGVLSTNDNAFGCFLARVVGNDDPIDLPRGTKRWPDAGLVSGPRARAAWRVLDAQFFGLAQRRRRLFVVVGAGESADPAAVLFEREGLRGSPPPCRGEAEGIATAAARGVALRGEDRGGAANLADNVALTKASRGGGNKAHVLTRSTISTSRAKDACCADTLICFEPRKSDPLVYGDISGPLDTGYPGPAILAGEWSIRRLTPTECERLQGFPVGYTAVPGASDCARYKAIGNSMAVPVMRWIGRRIAAVEGGWPERL